MLIENMIMAFSALRANKMRSFLTMLGIIIGIGSVISIVSIGDTMRGMFSSLYQDIGITQAYLGIGYWIDDTRQSDYFTMDELSRIKSVFGDKISYIDSAMSTSADAVAGRKKVKRVKQTPFWMWTAQRCCSGQRMRWGKPSARSCLAT